jgi:transcription initiation factor TFIIB
MAASRVARDNGSGGIKGGRDLHAAYQQISTMCETISLPKSIIDTTKMLFKRCDEEKLLKGKKQEAIIGACIFVACKQGRVGRTFKELMALTGVDKKVSSHPHTVPLSLLMDVTHVSRSILANH